MEISRGALLRVVKAARLSMQMAETLQKLFFDKSPWSIADDISGLLGDALYIMDGEDQHCDFKDSRTQKLLTGDMSDGDVTDWIVMMSNIRDKIKNSRESANIQKPQTMNKEELEIMYTQNGGYRNTPEGEWK